MIVKVNYIYMQCTQSITGMYGPVLDLTILA